MDATATPATTATAREGETLVATPKLTYTLRRNRDNELRAETEVALPRLDVAGDRDQQGYRVTLSTHKAYRGGGIEARASVARHREGFMTTDLFGDFSRSILKHPSRGTEKAIRTLHEQALALVPALLDEIESFYTAKRAKAAAEKARYEAARAA